MNGLCRRSKPILNPWETITCGRSPRADEVMAFGRRTVTMSFSGLRPIFLPKKDLTPSFLVRSLEFHYRGYCFWSPRRTCIAAGFAGGRRTRFGCFCFRYFFELRLFTSRAGRSLGAAEARIFADASCGRSAGCRPPSQTAATEDCVDRPQLFGCNRFTSGIAWKFAAF